MLEHPAHLTESNDDFFRTLLRYKYDTLEKNTLDLCIVFLSQFLQRGEKKRLSLWMEVSWIHSSSMKFHDIVKLEILERMEIFFFPQRADWKLDSITIFYLFFFFTISTRKFCLIRFYEDLALIDLRYFFWGR